MKIIIPDYIRKVKMSDKRRSYYYEYKPNTGIVNHKGKPIPKRFVKEESLNDEIYYPPDLKSGYAILAVSGNKKVVYSSGNITHIRKQLNNTLLRNFTTKQVAKIKLLVYDLKKQELVLVNPRSAGTAKLQTIRGQDIYSGNLHNHSRAIIVRQIKESFLPYVKNLTSITNFPVRVQMTIHDTVINELSKSDQAWDVGNRGYPYMKCMLDLLATGKIGNKQVMNPILPDDDRRHITEESIRFKAIEPNHKHSAKDTIYAYNDLTRWLEFNFVLDKFNHHF